MRIVAINLVILCIPWNWSPFTQFGYGSCKICAHGHMHAWVEVVLNPSSLSINVSIMMLCLITKPPFSLPSHKLFLIYPTFWHFLAAGLPSCHLYATFISYASRETYSCVTPSYTDDGWHFCLCIMRDFILYASLNNVEGQHFNCIKSFCSSTNICGLPSWYWITIWSKGLRAFVSWRRKRGTGVCKAVSGEAVQMAQCSESCAFGGWYVCACTSSQSSHYRLPGGQGIFFFLSFEYGLFDDTKIKSI